MKKVLILVNHDVVIYNFRLEIVQRLLKEGYEGIHRVVLMSEEEISDSISTGRINDGYTLSALELIHKKFS